MLRPLSSVLMSLAAVAGLSAEEQPTAEVPVAEAVAEVADNTSPEAVFAAAQAEFSRAHGAWMAGQTIQQLEQLQEAGLDLEQAMLGFAAVAQGGLEQVPSPETMQALYQTFSAAQEALAAQAALNDPYFMALRERDDVTFTDSGLAYEVLTAAEGASPSVGDTVTVHYTGTLADGTKFDSSVDRGEPASFPLNPGGLIDGWIEGLPLMTVGSSYRFYIPGHLAYGPSGRQPTIPPNATLVFDIELISIAPGNPMGGMPMPGR